MKDPVAVPVGSYLAAIREDARMSQADLAQAVTFSTATLSRIESGDKEASKEELSALLKALGTPKARQLADYLEQEWDELQRPPFDHPNLEALWEANLALRKLRTLRKDTELKAVFLRQVDLYETELRRVAEFLSVREHRAAFIGSIGVGKSTAISKLANLVKPDETKLDQQIVLETGGGGITLCEVHISQGPRYGLRIVPRTEDSIRRDVEDFCDYLMATTQQPGPRPSQDSGDEDGDPLGISKEVVRAIRNMANLTEKRREEAGKRVRIDPAKELAKQCGSAAELSIEILTRMNLIRRNKRDEWYPENHSESPAHWLQVLFADVNNGRNPEFTLPQKIEIIVPEPIFGSRELPFRIVDTKGIDQTAERQDLECHFDDPRTLVILCSRFNDAPEVTLQSLLRRAKDSGARDIAQKTMLLVLPRPEEAMAVKYDDGARVEEDTEGYDLKRDQIHLRLNQHGLSDVSVEFFNARDEDPREMRTRFIEKVAQYRNHHAAAISRLSQAVDRLSENRKNEQVRMIFEQVMSHLNSWINANRDVDLSKDGLHDPLVSAIDGTRHASTIRASVRRHGDWYNLDYYHHLSYGVRTLAVEHLGKKIEEFRVILKNLMQNDDLAPAKGFLEGVLSRLDSTVDETYQRIQAAGREAFKQTLARDYAYWKKCEDRWGQGSGYRDAISNMTDEEFRSDFLKEVQELVVNQLASKWKELVSLMETVLKENGAAVN